MTAEQVPTRETATQLATKLGAFAQTLSADERDLLATVIRRAAAPSEVQGFGATYAFLGGGIPPPSLLPAPQGG